VGTSLSPHFSFVMKSLDLAKLFGLVGLCEFAGVIGSLSMGDSISSWYSMLAKPSWTPPNWLFAPVWVTLYALMGVSLFLVFKVRKPKKLKIQGISVFGVQLVANVLWSMLFFGYRQVGWGFVEIVFLWGSIIATMFLFWRISRTSSLVLVPYLVWVSIASGLNLSILILNYF
jgi:translocator protein